jgi:hypothetical protein
MTGSADGTPSSRVAAVVTGRDDGAGLLEVVAALEAATVGEVLVVDDGSRLPEALVALDTLERRGVEVVRQDQAGLGRARNLGTRMTRAPYLLHLGTDAVPTAEFVEGAAARLDHDPTEAVVTADGRHRSTGARIELGEHDPTLLVTGNHLGTLGLVRRRALDDVGGFDEQLVDQLEWDLWLGLTAAGWRFAKLDLIGFEVLDRPDREPPPPDDVVAVAEAVAIAEKHRGLLARYLSSLVANYRTALIERRGVEDGVTATGRAGRDRLDQVAEAVAARTVAQRDAARARSRVAEVEAARVAAVEALEVERARRGAAEEALAAAGDRSAELGRQLAELRATRTYRWLVIPRGWYGSVRARGGRPADR